MEATGRGAQGTVSNGWRTWGHAGAFMVTLADLRKQACWEPRLSLRQPKSNQCPRAETVIMVMPQLPALCGQFPGWPSSGPALRNLRRF